MNKQSAKSKRLVPLLLSLLLAVIFAMVSFGSCVIHADSSSGEGGGNEASGESNVYYFSDYTGCEQIAENLKNILSIEVNLNNFSDEIDTEQAIKNMYADGVFEDINESYVIFEIRNVLVITPDWQDGTLITDYLYNIFKGLKDRKCKVMFICGTDEARFESHNAFLDFVDIHINVDIFYTFISNVIHRIEADYGEEKISNCTLLLDFCFSSFKTNTDNYLLKYERKFVTEFLIPYFKMAFRNELCPDFSDSNTKIRMMLKNINVYYHYGNNLYYNIIQNQYIDFGDVNYNYFYNQRIYAIGATTNGEYDYFGRWVDSVNNIASRTGIDIDTFILNTEAYDLSAFNISFLNIFKAGHSFLGYDTMLLSIIYDFVNDNDLTQYDNWSGRCDITHKFLTVGPDGWMYDLRAMGEGYHPEWQCFQDYEFLLQYQCDDPAAWTVDEPSHGN